MAAQERNAVGCQDKHSGDHKGEDQVNEQPEHSGGYATLEGGHAQYAAGEILPYRKKRASLKEAINNRCLEKLADKEAYSTERNRANKRSASGERETAC